MPALIIWGFFYHYITFKLIPITDVLYLVFGYLALATLTIIFVHLYDEQFITQKLRYVRLFAPLLLQFTIGSMIGGVFIFYWFSGSILVSWPFITFIVVLLVGLEFYKHYLENPIVQFALYSLAAFLLFAVALPFFFTSINPLLFITAGCISLALAFALIWLLKKSQAIAIRKHRIIIACVFVFAVMNVFYFYNFIPPVPLSIRDAGVYHNVSKSGSDYVVEFEPRSFWQRLSLIPTIHLASGEQAFVFTSIYSPSDLDTDIVHDWQYFDPAQNKWISESKVSFHLIGGRQDGYRGYSYKTNVTPGKWRVYTETPRGQVLGVSEFKVASVNLPPALQQETK
ncbi:MAG TPA: DUF2914 domain-containing protein [Patescibacteria group bacterium]|nr:DUF2914 domain-containing protein [Patescibacteria group bacterium]